MTAKVIGLTLAATLSFAQSVPLYKVTVIDRTVSAVDYQYRDGPTGIDFRGTVLWPAGKGEAIVESKEGRTEIDVKFQHLAAWPA